LTLGRTAASRRKRIRTLVETALVDTGAGSFILLQKYFYTQHSFLQKRTHKMAENLKGKKVAILVTDGFEQVELLQPREALNKAGAETKVVSLKEAR
jgi:hypothetical protein